jgi:hypothetical protein
MRDIQNEFPWIIRQSGNEAQAIVSTRHHTPAVWKKRYGQRIVERPSWVARSDHEAGKAT